MDFERKKPRKENVWIRRDKQKMGLRPYISANLGKIKAAIVHPINMLEPINPTAVLELQDKSIYSYQLFRFVSIPWIGLLNSFVPQKYVALGLSGM